MNDALARAAAQAAVLHHSPRHYAGRLELWNAGENTADIADILNLPEATVANSIARYREFNRRVAA